MPGLHGPEGLEVFEFSLLEVGLHLVFELVVGFTLGLAGGGASLDFVDEAFGVEALEEVLGDEDHLGGQITHVRIV